ncbi:MAG: MarR family winged helix-turn-helix transcriptional regulator [Planctomycetota bacterium]|jgi:DNA-binding MarR family transcriptional regulator
MTSDRKNSMDTGRYRTPKAGELSTAERARVGMWIRLARCSNLALRELRAKLRDDCTMPQFDVLAQLCRDEQGLTFSALSERLLVTAGNLTGIVDRLEKQGFVRRETNPQDRRQTFIRVTDKGQEYADFIIPRHEQDIIELFKDMPDNTVMNLRSDLDQLVRMLDQRPHPNG